MAKNRLSGPRSRISVLDTRIAAPISTKSDSFYNSKKWADLRAAAKRRDRWQCTEPSCATPHRGHGGRLVVDHIVARTEGGEDTLTNLRTLCPRCDNRRHADKGRHGPNGSSLG